MGRRWLQSLCSEAATFETFEGQTSQEGTDIKNLASLLYVVVGVFNFNVHTKFVAFLYIELNAVLFRIQDDKVLGVRRLRSSFCFATNAKKSTFRERGQAEQIIFL